MYMAVSGSLLPAYVFFSVWLFWPSYFWPVLINTLGNKQKQNSTPEQATSNRQQAIGHRP